jgi:hypothetical protein
MASVILIPVDMSEPLRRIDVIGLEDFQEAVGGNIEGVTYASDRRVCAFINEEGKLLGLPVNWRATKLFAGQLYGDVIVGPCLIASIDDMGETVDAPAGFESQISSAA